MGVLRFLLKNWRESLIVGMAVLLFIGWQTIGILSNHNEVLSRQNTAYSHVTDSAFNVAKFYHNKNGELVQQIRMYELTTRDLKDIGNQLGFDKKGLQDQVGNLKNLIGYWQGKAVASGNVVVAVRDTTIKKDNEVLQAKVFDWNNKYLFVSFAYFPSLDTADFDYVYDIGGFELTAYKKKERVKGKLFKRRVLVADVKFGDPSLKVGEFKGVLIKRK